MGLLSGYNKLTKESERTNKMKDYINAKKDSIAKIVVNTALLTSAGAVIWIMLIGADRLMGIMGVI